MSSEIQKNSIVFSSSRCLIEPYVFSRSNQMTRGLLFLSIFILSYNIGVCSMNCQPGKQGIPAFCIDVLKYPLFIMNLIILFTMTLKKILPSSLSKEIGQN